MAKPLTISKRALGFPISLSMSHWLLVRQQAAWLKSLGKLAPEADEALKTVPHIEITDEMFRQATELGECELTRWGRPQGGGWTKPAIHKRKTVRVRAADVDGMVLLLKSAAAFAIGGQLGATLRTRAEQLEEISTLDKLADAGR